MKPLVILDVDNTLISSNEQLNETLLEAIKNAGITEVILLTNMGHKEVARTLSAQGEIVYISRAALILEMKQKYNINVIDVIVPADLTVMKSVTNPLLNVTYEDRNGVRELAPQFTDHRVGNIYKLEIEPWLIGDKRTELNRLLPADNIDEFFTKKPLALDPTGGALCALSEQYRMFAAEVNALTSKASDFAPLIGGKKDPKGQMLNVYLEQHPELNEYQIIFFDDKQECLDSVKAVFPEVKTVLVDMKKNRSTIQYNEELASPEVVSLIASLSRYIERVERNKTLDGKNNYGFGFWHHKTSRGLNREVNYLLAIELRSQLMANGFDGGPLFLNKDEILARRDEIIISKGINTKVGYVARGLNSAELNQIIDDAVRSSTLALD